MLNAQEPPLTGSIPGNERWLVELRSRSFNLRQQLQQIRATTSATQRATMVAQLDQLAVTDQRDLATLVAGLGGRVERHFWVRNALAVEIPPSALLQLRQNARVQRLVPIVARGPSESDCEIEAPLLLPIETSTNANNHRVAEARTILQNAGITNTTGNGVVVAFFDTGIDADGGNGTSHPAFDDGSVPPVTRILTHIRAGNIDCNNLPGGFYQPCNHSRQARHGTGVAAITAGRLVMDPLNPMQPVSEAGHAPDASLIDVSIIRVPSIPLSNPPQPNPAAFWITDTLEMLAGIQALRGFLLSGPTELRLRVVNISFDGWADPGDPVSLTFDQLAFEEDALLVTSAGNAADETFQSNGFYNGLAVGSVHARTAPQGQFLPMGDTSRGPLNSNWSRYFPDLCATGAGTATSYLGGTGALIRMPLLDLRNAGSRFGCAATVPPEYVVTLPAGPVYFGRGTSMAAPQVAGAAAIYRGARTSATAEETRAALLLNTVTPLPFTPEPSQNPVGNRSDQDTYRSRNTYGVGYVRDDLLAEFAVRGLPLAPPIKALHQSVQVSQSVPSATVQYPNLTPGNRYAVVICWQRDADPDADQEANQLANVDLLVWSGTQTGGTLLARSTTPANSYERVSFRAPAGVTTVTIEVVATQTPSAPVAVQVVAREFVDPASPPASPQLAVTGSVVSLSQAGACTTLAPDLRITRRIPTTYGGAYGSRGFTLARQDGANAYRGLDIASMATANGHLHVEVDDSQMGGPITFGAILLRTWRPFVTAGTLTFQNIWIDVLTTSSGAGATGTPTAPTSGANSFPGPFPVSVPTPTWTAEGFDTWPVVINLGAQFTYPGAADQNLHIWFEYAAPTPGTVLEVDAIEDMGSTSQAMSWPLLGGSSVQPGWGLVMGLAPGSNVTSTARLQVFGEPCLGQMFLLDLTQGAPSLGAFLLGGSFGQAPYAPNPLCNQFVQNPSSLFAPIDAAGHASWTFAVPSNASLLFTEMAFQILVAQPPAGVLSNGVLVRVGGVL